MSITKNILNCFASKFTRLKYFHGMLLTEDDFQEEQTYFREKHKLHNRMHGYGVVWGLGLRPPDLTEGNNGNNGDEDILKIIIEPGFALDCDGNEIIVCNEHVEPLKDKIKLLKQQGKICTEDECGISPYEHPKIFIGIKYCECNAKPVQQYTAECSTDDLKPQYSRVKEGYSVKIFTKDELPSCGEYYQGQQNDRCVTSGRECPGVKHCQVKEHFIILGSIEIDCSKLAIITEDQINVNDKRPPEAKEILLYLIVDDDKSTFYDIVEHGCYIIENFWFYHPVLEAVTETGNDFNTRCYTLYPIPKNAKVTHWMRIPEIPPPKKDIINVNRCELMDLEE